MRKFVIITHVKHRFFEGRYYAYGPYVREMNVWEKFIGKLIVVAPIEKGTPGVMDLPYKCADILFIKVPAFDFTSLANTRRAIFRLPGIAVKIFRGMFIANHIHLRCPGNMGLLGCVVQLLFPLKYKTAKYAGNWDRESEQPLTNRVQQWILRNTLLTKRIKTLVYGKWPDATKNIVPFFTASYSEKQAEVIEVRRLHGKIKLIFAGDLVEGKRPLFSIKICEALLNRGLEAQLDLYGEGVEREVLEEYIRSQSLGGSVYLKGRCRAEDLAKVYKDSHFLIFISRSEGWPKVVAEAMWWGCLPVSTAVSCVPEMLGHGERGELVDEDIGVICERIKLLIDKEELYKEKCKKAMEWAREYTLERFEREIEQFVAR